MTVYNHIVQCIEIELILKITRIKLSKQAILFNLSINTSLHSFKTAKNTSWYWTTAGYANKKLIIVSNSLKITIMLIS